MEGIFFAINEIWWLNPIAGGSVLIALVGGICTVLSLQYKSQINQGKIVPIPSKYVFTVIDPTNVQYAQKSLINIRQYLAHQYNPKHSWAHIPQDIRTYTHDLELIGIIEELEKIEFSGKIAELSVKESINQKLLKKL